MVDDEPASNSVKDDGREAKIAALQQCFDDIHVECRALDEFGHSLTARVHRAVMDELYREFLDMMRRWNILFPGDAYRLLEPSITRTDRLAMFNSVSGQNGSNSRGKF